MYAPPGFMAWTAESCSRIQSQVVFLLPQTQDSPLLVFPLQHSIALYSLSVAVASLSVSRQQY